MLDKYPVFTAMLEDMTTKSDMLRLIEQRGVLKDSELARILGVPHQQVYQAARGLAAAIPAATAADAQRGRLCEPACDR